MQLSPNALKVLYRLKAAGFAAFLVGGGVRDLLLGEEPKDFDIATDARPNEIRKIFSNCRLIGRRFRLAHVYFRSEIVEVATFRAAAGENVYGTQEEDAWRRDFTLNALYYNIENFAIVDFTGGMNDLRTRTLRMIGNPTIRYQEDPVRMLRAIRLAAKLGLTIETNTAAAITPALPLLHEVSNARLLDETIKWFFSKCSLTVYLAMQQYGAFAQLFPQTAACSNAYSELLQRAFRNTDLRLQTGKTLNPAFLFAVLLWPPLQTEMQNLKKQGMKLYPSLLKASKKILQTQVKIVSIPRHFIQTMQAIWNLQYRMINRKRKKLHVTLNHPRFKAAYDFMLLRAESGEELAPHIEFWSQHV